MNAHGERWTDSKALMQTKRTQNVKEPRIKLEAYTIYNFF